MNSKNSSNARIEYISYKKITSYDLVSDSESNNCFLITNTEAFDIESTLSTVLDCFLQIFFEKKLFKGVF